MNKRLIWADSLKGFLIMLVVLGHAIQIVLGEACWTNHMWNIIYSFHMPAFIAVSGYLAFRPNMSGGGKNAISVVWRRFRQLLIPFFLWTIILLININSLNWFSIAEFLIYPDKGLWFLWVLFFITTMFMFGSWLSDKIHLKQEIITLALCCIFSGIMVFYNIRILGFQFFAYYFIIYSMGYYLHKYRGIIITNNLFVLAVLALCWLFLAWFWQMHELSTFLNNLPIPATLTQYGYRIVTALVAIYLLFALGPRFLNENEIWNKPFVSMGILSLGIYVVHFIFLKRIVTLYKTWEVDDIFFITFSFITGLLLSWLVVWLLSKWRFSAFYLLGKI